MAYGRTRLLKTHAEIRKEKGIELKLNKDSEYLSSTDTSFQMLHKTILNELFQSKSIYEN